MSSNAEQFDLPESIHWTEATLERCNLVYTNGSDAGVNFIVHIDQMPQNLLVCQSASTYNRVGSFFVGSEPFNPQESQTVHNSNPGRALDRLDVKVYDLSGSDAAITNTFYLRLNIVRHSM
jgi:hypothetical protein